MKQFWRGLGFAGCLLPFGAAAAPVTLQLTPADMLAQTHSHAIITTVTGTFRQLSGTLVFDQVQRTCRIDVSFIVRSLTLPNALIESETMSTGLLDEADYPVQHFTGICSGDRLNGDLTMRGQTHPFSMMIRYDVAGGQVTAIHTDGILDRYDWGLDGLKFTVSKMIRVTNDISLTGAVPTAR